MHMFSREKKFFGGHGIVGSQVPIGTGLGFAHKYQHGWRGGRLLHGRRCGQPGPGLRELQHGGPVEACRWSSSSRTTSTPWARRSGAGPRPQDLHQRGHAYGIPGEGRRHARAGCMRPPTRRCQARAQGRGADHPGDAHLPLSRPLHVRSGEVPQTGRSR
jgi:hypothetical protein